MKKKKMKYKKYNPLKHMKTQTAMMTTESIGYAIPFMVAGSIPVSYTHLTLPTSDLV